MDFLTVNMVGPYRNETFEGREYIVGPARLIVPGVLEGSQGSLLYQSEDVTNEPAVWNGMPLVVYHPQQNGQYVSARQPSVLQESRIGWVFGANNNSGNLDAEAWFDVQLTNTADKKLHNGTQIMPRLKSGGQIELSTGLKLDKIQRAGEHNGKKYTHIARNFRPDHVAVLPDREGACAIKDGCGIGVANKKSKKTTNKRKSTMPLTREQIVADLVANCDCWKGEADTLNELDDAQLEKIHKGSVAHRAQVTTLNALIETVKANGAPAGITVNELTEFVKGKITPPVKVPTPPPVTPPAASPTGPLTLEQWEATMPAEAKTVWNAAKTVEQEKRRELVQKLVGNIQDDAKRLERATKLMQLPVDQLQERVDDAEAFAANLRQQEPQRFSFHYNGAGGPTVNAGEVLPVLDIETARKSYDPNLQKTKTAS